MPRPRASAPASSTSATVRQGSGWEVCNVTLDAALGTKGPRGEALHSLSSLVGIRSMQRVSLCRRQSSSSSFDCSVLPSEPMQTCWRRCSTRWWRCRLSCATSTGAPRFAIVLVLMMCSSRHCVHICSLNRLCSCATSTGAWDLSIRRASSCKCVSPSLTAPIPAAATECLLC